MARLEDRPFVSVITACLNSERYLERAIKSVLFQTYPNIEYIVIDGGSTDDTLNVIKKYENSIAHWVSKADKGVFDAMNRGIDRASGSIIYFLNSDDYLENDYVIEKVVNLFKKREDVDFVYGNMKVYDLSLNKFWLKRYPRFITKAYLVNDSIGHPAAFFRTHCFKRVGCYDLSFKIASDREWFLRALYKHRLKPCHINLAISVFQLGGMSNDAAYREQQSAEIEYIRKRYFSPSGVRIAGFLDFLCSGNMFRKVIMFLLGNRGYSLLKKIKSSCFGKSAC